MRKAVIVTPKPKVDHPPSKAIYARHKLPDNQPSMRERLLAQAEAILLRSRYGDR